MNNEPNCALVVNKKTRVLYKYLGDDVYKNLVTGVEGKYRPEDAKKFFSIPAVLNHFVTENENILGLIELGFFDFATMIGESVSVFYCKKVITIKDEK